MMQAEEAVAPYELLEEEVEGPTPSLLFTVDCYDTAQDTLDNVARYLFQNPTAICDVEYVMDEYVADAHEDVMDVITLLDQLFPERVSFHFFFAWDWASDDLPSIRLFDSLERLENFELEIESTTPESAIFCASLVETFSDCVDVTYNISMRAVFDPKLGRCTGMFEGGSSSNFLGVPTLLSERLRRVIVDNQFLLNQLPESVELRLEFGVRGMDVGGVDISNGELGMLQSLVDCGIIGSIWANVYGSRLAAVADRLRTLTHTIVTTP